MKTMTEKVMDCLKAQNIKVEYDEKTNGLMIRQSGKYIELETVVNVLQQMKDIESYSMRPVEMLLEKMAVILKIIEHNDSYIALIYYNMSYHGLDEEA